MVIYWLRRTGYPYKSNLEHIFACMFATSVGLLVAVLLEGLVEQWWWRVVLASLAFLAMTALVLRPTAEEVRIFTAVIKKRRGGAGAADAPSKPSSRRTVSSGRRPSAAASAEPVGRRRSRGGGEAVAPSRSTRSALPNGN